MKKRLLLPLLVLLALLAGGAAFSPQRTQRKAAHAVVFRSGSRAAACSGTAVAPRVLLTANHCDLGGEVVYLDGEATAHRIAGRVADSHDSLLVVLADAPFRDHIKIGRVAPVQQGERVYWWGSPRGMRDIYRTGYLAGAVVTPEAEMVPGATVYIIATPAAMGDSGAGIYAADGRLVGVETYGIFGGLFTGYYSLAFTEAQLRQAGL